MNGGSNLKKQSSNTSNENISIYNILPLIFVLSVIPLVVRLKVVFLDPSVVHVWINEVNYDFFSYYKASLMVMIALILALISIFKKLTENYKFKKSVYYIPIFIYSTSVILSSILSQNKGVSFFGFPDRHEGMFILLSYMVVLVTAINFANSEKYIKILFMSLAFSSALLGILGISQYFGFDFFQSTLGKSLIVPSQYQEVMKNAISFNFGTYSIYSTLFNTNNVGSYMAMLFPISVVFFYYSKTHKQRILSGLLCILMFFNLIGCNSRAGWVGAIIALLITIYFIRKVIVEKWKTSLAMLCILCLVFTGMNFISDSRLFQRIGVLEKNDNVPQNSSITDEDNFINIHMTSKIITIISEKTQFKIYFDNEELILKDKNDNLLDDGIEKQSNDSIILGVNDPDYQQYYLHINKEMNAFRLYKHDEIYFDFAVSIDGFKFIDTLGNQLDTIPQVETWGFRGKEFIGSSRGYIWSRSIPLLKNTLFLGYGPDTFALHFPQHDYIGKYKFLYNPKTIVDKPHNLYLQIAINTGILSLLAILAIFCMYTHSSLKLFYKKSLDSFIDYAGIACFVAFIGYAIAALFNDSIVGVSPVFWCILGIGISINQYLNHCNKRIL